MLPFASYEQAVNTAGEAEVAVPWLYWLKEEP